LAIFNIYCIVVKIVPSTVLRTSPEIRRNALAGTVGVEVGVMVGVGVGVCVIIGVMVGVMVGVGVGVGSGGIAVPWLEGDPLLTTLLKDNLLLVASLFALCRSL